MINSNYYKLKYRKYKKKYITLKKQKINFPNLFGKGNSNNINKEEFLNKLAKEYKRYKIVRKILNLERNPKYSSSIERLLILMANHKDNTRTDEVFIDIPENHEYFAIMRQLIQYNFISANEISDLINKIIIIIKKFLSKTKFKIPEKYGKEGNIYFCNDYKIALNSKRIEALYKSISPEYKEIKDLLILIALMRYECIVSKLQQWNLSFKWYKYLYDEENARIEAFSSPFNSQLMLIDTNTKFCSLFYDTDKYFGSLGNIFDLDIKKATKNYSKNVGVIFVPPISYYIVKEAMKYILNWSSKTKNISYFFVCFGQPTPYEYSKYYRDMRISNNLLFYRILGENQWHFENTTISNEIVKFYWGKEMYIFVLGNPAYKRNYYPMLQKLFDDESVDETYKKLENNLSKEYNRYLVVQEIVKLNEHHEWKNILERLLNSMANLKEQSRKDPVFTDIPENHFIYKKMDSELKEKRIFDNKIIKEIKKLIDKFLKNGNYQKIKTYGQQDNLFYCDDYKQKIDKVRMLALIKKADLIGMGPYYVPLILIVMLRYDSIMAGGQNWNVPFKWYNYINDKYGVRFEGFASPLNSQLLLLGQDTTYCSLFVDTDEVFGSKGNIFDFDIKKYSDDNKGKISVQFNPPYIEYLMNKLIDLIDKWYSIVPELRVFIGLPYWKDTEAIKRLENHEHLKFKKILGPDEYYYENSLNEAVPKIYHTSKYEVFVISNFEKSSDEPDYKNVAEQLKPPY